MILGCCRRTFDSSFSETIRLEPLFLYPPPEPISFLCSHVAALEELRHPNLARVCSVFHDSTKGCAFIQMPWYRGGNLQDWMAANPPATRSVRFCKRVLQDLVQGISHLHQSNNVHCEYHQSSSMNLPPSYQHLNFLRFFVLQHSRNSFCKGLLLFCPQATSSLRTSS